MCDNHIGHFYDSNIKPLVLLLYNRLRGSWLRGLFLYEEKTVKNDSVLFVFDLPEPTRP